MEEELVEIFNEEGNVVSLKKRSEINKKNDLLKTVLVLVFDQSGRVYLSVIPRTGDFLWKGQWGVTCTGIVRRGEDPYFTAARTMQREIGIVEEVEFAGEKLRDLEGVKRFVSIFTCRTNKQLKPNPFDMEKLGLFAPEEVEQIIAEKRAAPTLAQAWEMLK